MRGAVPRCRMVRGKKEKKKKGEKKGVIWAGMLAPLWPKGAHHPSLSSSSSRQHCLLKGEKEEEGGADMTRRAVAVAN